MKKKKGYNVGGQVPKQSNQTQAQQINKSLRSQKRAMNTTNAQAQRMAAAKSPTQQTRRAPTRPSQVGAMQALKTALAKGPTQQARRTPTRPSKIAAMQAQKVAASRGQTQQARQAPAGSRTSGARKMTPAELRRITRTRPRTSRPPSIRGRR